MTRMAQRSRTEELLARAALVILMLVVLLS